MRVSLYDIMAYTDCPLKYLYRTAGVEIQTPIKVEFSQKIHKTIYYFYYSLMNNNVVGGEAMKAKWASLWSRKLTMQEIMFRHKDDRTDLEMKGISMLLNFHRVAKLTPIVPIAVEQEYCIPCGDHELSGSIELIREIEDGGRVIELVDFKTGDFTPDQFLTQHDLTLTAQSYAFRHLFNAKEDRLVYYFLKTGKQYNTTRDQAEYDRFIKVIDGVAGDIERENFYPKYSPSCKWCPYQQECGRWNA